MIPELFWIKGPWPGKLAISSRPRGGDWLQDEIRGWRSAHVDTVVSLLEKGEEIQLDLRKESQMAKANGIRFVAFPTEDRGVPASTQSAVELLRAVNRALEQGENIAVHCRQGIGRSALIAAGTLMAAGESPEAALEAIRTARGLSVPETQEQLYWLQRDLAESLAAVHR